MIWWTLALFAVSFVLTALLAPKPNIENARPDQLNPDTFPRATENAPIPLVLGRVRMEAPNTIWYGNFRSVPITERIRVSLFKKKTVTVGHNYYIDLHLALAMGPRTTMSKIFVDDKLFWSGTTSATAPTGISASDASFFGGHKEGGGLSINGTYYPGSMSLAEQPVDSHLISQFGAGNVPAYLGTAHIMMPGMYIGESPQLRKMAFILENYTNALGLSNNGKIGEDMNPAEAIYQIMTDKWRGMGIDPSVIDLVKLKALGETLYVEQNGCSVQVTAEQNGKQLISEILRQIDAIAYQDPETGKIIYSLIRNDYDLETIPYFDEDDILSITSFSRSGWDEVVAQVKVTYPQREKESDAVAISQDMATVSMIGRLRSTTVSMPFCYDKNNANRIASRERSQLSVPLFNMTIEFNRNANGLRPGAVFKMSWPEYNFVNLVMRVQTFDLGSLLEGKIIVNCVQDKFSLSDTVFAPPEDSGWVSPVSNPADVVVYDVIECPRILCNLLEYPPADGTVAFIPLAMKPQTASNAFDVVSGEISGALATRDPEYCAYLGCGVLKNAYPLNAGIGDGLDSTVGIDISGAGSTLFSGTVSDAIIRSGEAGFLYINGEWLSFNSATSLGGGEWRLTGIRRGLFGTRPRAHAIGTRVFEVGTDMLPSGQVDDLIEGDTLYYKILDRVGRRVQDEVNVTQRTKVLNGNVANRPLRPRYLQIDGLRTGIVIEGAVNKPLTWRASDRRQTQVTFENDAAQTPDLAETYDVDIFVNGTRNATLSATGVSSPYSIPFSLTSIGSSNCEARVTSKRTVGDLRSSVDYAVLPFVMLQTYTAHAVTITNPGAESGMTGWTNSGMASGVPSVAPRTGAAAFTGGTTASTSAYQDVAVPAGAISAVDIGAAVFYASWWQAGFTDADTGNVEFAMYDASSNLLGTDPGPGMFDGTGTWTQRTRSINLPIGTRTVRMTMKATRVSGTNNDAYFDDFTAEVRTP